MSSPPIAIDEFSVSPPVAASTLSAPKSPPLAFAPTSNDALAPRSVLPHTGDGGLPSTTSNMGRLSLSESPFALQAIIDKQSEALRQLHKGFNAERESWDLERQRFFERIHSLEQLLRNGEHHSPAKSPVLTPPGASELHSPQPRSMHPTMTLPTIVEDENIQPLAARREGAPHSIMLPREVNSLGDEPHDRTTSAVSFMNAEGLRVEEIPNPPRSAGLSPPPPVNRMLAGHTPIKAPRRPTPPPERSLSMDGIEDTPTRYNTQVNAYYLTLSDEEEDVPLKGPLNMPELPHNPGESNFTLEAFAQRLQEIHDNPTEEKSKPLVYAKPSPGLASPADRSNTTMSPSQRHRILQDPLSPANTRALDSHAIQSPDSNLGSTLSPSMSNTKSPDLAGALSPQEQHEAKIHQEFQEGGIRLKKKTSTNFGAPFGSMAAFPMRKLS